MKSEFFLFLPYMNNMNIQIILNTELYLAAEWWIIFTPGSNTVLNILSTDTQNRMVYAVFTAAGLCRNS